MVRRRKLKKPKKPKAIRSNAKKAEVWREYCGLFEQLGLDAIKQAEFCGPHHLAFYVAELIEAEFERDHGR